MPFVSGCLYGCTDGIDCRNGLVAGDETTSLTGSIGLAVIILKRVDIYPDVSGGIRIPNKLAIKPKQNNQPRLVILFCFVLLYLLANNCLSIHKENKTVATAVPTAMIVEIVAIFSPG